MLPRLRYALTIFVGAFLLFQIQPLIARYILPWFGGGASVWATCLVFFQLTLLAGYAYAHALHRFATLRNQAIIHLALLAVSLALLPITPDAAWKPDGAAAPTWRILALLVVNVGLPCLVISSTAPLLQNWFGSVHEASPYKFYALSNVGSLLGLLTYPFVVEPLLGLHTQTSAWSVGYVVFALASAWCAAVIAWSAPAKPDAPDEPEPELRKWNRTLWFVLPCFGVVLLLGATNELTKNIAPFPFLWVVPLSLYLVSFAICFASEGWYHRRLWMGVYSLLLIPTLWLSFMWRYIGLPAFVFVWSATLFAGCMICHGELARRKPGRQQLTSFYLAIAVGGACGGVLVALVAPLVFTRFWEVPIALTGTFFLAGATLNLGIRKTQPGLIVVWGLAAAMLFGLTMLPMRAERDHIASIRNFYGRVSVSEEHKDGQRVRTMYYGRVNHGTQVMDPGRSMTPTLYYAERSGIARVVEKLRKRGPMSMGVVGLGTGTLAALGGKADTVRFYELNPAVERLARKYFTYLSDSPAKVEVVLGDGRISLDRERRRGVTHGFDVLVLDAFTSEAIPIHLLTKEAFELYFHHLKPGGALVVHISNTYLDLSDVVRNHAVAFDKRTVLIRYRFAKQRRAEADWVIISSDAALMDALAASATPWPGPPSSIRWTDNYSNLFGILK